VKALEDKLTKSIQDGTEKQQEIDALRD